MEDDLPADLTRSANEDARADNRLEPIHAREASIEIRAAVEGAGDNHTAEITWSTGAAVRRYHAMRDEFYDEVLSLDAKHIRTGRLNSGGAPVLNSHRSHSLGDQIGHIVAGSVKLGKTATATARFSSRPDVQPIVQDIRDGIIKNVSVGYRVHKFVRTPGDPEKGTVAQYRAEDWEPMEISAVPIGADAEAGIRSDAPTNHCEIVEAVAVGATRAAARPMETTMTDEEKAAAAAAAQADATRAATDPARGNPAGPPPHANLPADAMERIRAEERARIAEITSLGTRGVIAADVVERAVKEGTSVEGFRGVIFDTLIERSGSRNPTQTAHVLLDESEKIRGAMTNAIEHMRDPSVKLTDEGRELRGLNLMGMARLTLERRGIKANRMSDLEVAGLALRAPGMESTSDLTTVLGNVINRTLRNAYQYAPRTFTPFTRETTLKDFRPVTRTQISGAPALLPVPEHGEYQYGVVSDGAEMFQLATYGRLIAFTRQALINDDLNALMDIPRAFGVRAATLESGIVYAIFGLNPNMADGNPLFSAAHGNLAGAGTTLSVTSLGVARGAMRLQKSLEGEFINVVARYLIVPSALEVIAWQLTQGVIVATQNTNTNPFGPSGATPLTVIVEPRLDAYSPTAWYLAADPSQIDTIETAYLAGADRPYTEQRVGWEVDGIETKARHDFAAKAIDWRGMYKNPGA